MDIYTVLYTVYFSICYIKYIIVLQQYTIFNIYYIKHITVS